MLQFLGSESMKDKVGLNCSYVVAKKPEGAPTSQRAIPTTIFSAEPAVARSFIRKWIKEMPPVSCNRSLILIQLCWFHRWYCHATGHATATHGDIAGEHVGKTPLVLTAMHDVDILWIMLWSNGSCNLVVCVQD